MAVNYTNKKRNYVSRLQNNANAFRDIIAEGLALRQEAIDNDFQSGGANAITDADLNGGEAPFPHLAAADLVAVLAAYVAVDGVLAATNRTHYKALAKMEA